MVFREQCHAGLRRPAVVDALQTSFPIAVGVAGNAHLVPGRPCRAAVEVDVREVALQPPRATTRRGRRGGSSPPGRGSSARRWHPGAPRPPARPKISIGIVAQDEGADAIMIRAALVITRADAPTPSTMAPRASRWLRYCSRIRLMEEHLVVHRQAEQDGEHQHRGERIIGTLSLRRSGSAPQPHWKTATTDSVRSADAEQVEYGRLERDQHDLKTSIRSRREPDHDAQEPRHAVPRLAGTGRPGGR